MPTPSRILSNTFSTDHECLPLRRFEVKRKRQNKEPSPVLSPVLHIILLHIVFIVWIKLFYKQYKYVKIIHKYLKELLSLHNCPNCHNPTISTWKKLSLSAIRKITCKECDSFISIPDWSYIIDFLPFALLLGLAYTRLQIIIKIVCCLILVTILSLIKLLHVPLIKVLK